MERHQDNPMCKCYNVVYQRRVKGHTGSNSIICMKIVKNYVFIEHLNMW